MSRKTYSPTTTSIPSVAVSTAENNGIAAAHPPARIEAPSAPNARFMPALDVGVEVNGRGDKI